MLHEKQHLRTCCCGELRVGVSLGGSELRVGGSFACSELRVGVSYASSFRRYAAKAVYTGLMFACKQGCKPGEYLIY